MSARRLAQALDRDPGSNDRPATHRLGVVTSASPLQVDGRPAINFAHGYTPTVNDVVLLVVKMGVRRIVGVEQ